MGVCNLIEGFVAAILDLTRVTKTIKGQIGTEVAWKWLKPLFYKIIMIIFNHKFN